VTRPAAQLDKPEHAPAREVDRGDELVPRVGDERMPAVGMAHRVARLGEAAQHVLDGALSAVQDRHRTDRRVTDERLAVADELDRARPR